jgi:threonine dehydrogenase-like Zn-dependent dehydrogenase
MQVVATDLLETRLKLAREFGAVAVCRPERSADASAERTEMRIADCGLRTGEGQTRNAEKETPNLEHRTSDSGSRPCSAAARPQSTAAVAGNSRAPKNLAGIVEKLTHGRGLDAAVIAVPSDDVVREAQGLVRGGGQVLVFAHTRRGAETALDLATVCVDEKDLIGSYSADFLLQEEVARLVFSRRLDVRRLVTHQFPLEQTAAAVELAAHPSAESLKVVVSQI